MQKEVLSLLVLFSFFVFVYSSGVPLVKYYDNSIESHACLPSDFSCLYNEVVTINDSSLISCSDINASRILGLSDVTNAHVEIGNFSNNYSQSICIKKELFEDNSFYYTQSGEECNPEYICLFGLSGTNNAHLSSCEVFGSSEIKFCVLGSIITPPGKDGVCVTHGTYPANTLVVPENERCLEGNPTNYVDFNLDFIASWTCQGIGEDTLSPTCYASTEECVPPGCGVISGDCDIFSFDVKKSDIRKGTEIEYSCYSNNIDVNLAIFDLKGNQVFPFGGGQYTLKDTNSCSVTSKKIIIANWPTDSLSASNFLAQLSVGNKCVKQDFFAITSTEESIPDSNPIIAVMIC